ncbi:tol-pal system protein YbgF [Methylomagnum sp.]
MAEKIVIAGLMAAGLLYGEAAMSAPNQYDQPYDEAGYGVATLEERVAKLEKRLSGNTLMEMSNRVEKLQAEALKLRGDVEELTHELEKARKQQRDMYTDLDQRLQKAAAAPTPPPAENSAPPAPAGGDPSAIQPQAGAAPAPPAASPPPPPPPAPVADPAVRQAAYQKAFGSLKDGKYSEAIRDFKGFIAAYPSGEYTDNAYYWLAEAYYVNRDFPAARDNFRKMTKEFPQSAKVADAYLKLGFIEYENGQYAAAKDLLNDVVKRYPDSSAAKLAEKRLERMRQEKH